MQVREATNNDRFMVASGVLAEIARATNDYQEYPKLFAMLWKRLTDLEHVMHVTKALHLCEYLLRHGAERFISDAKRRARDIAALQKYKHYDEQNQDDAKEARAKAKAVYALLMDDLLLAQERGKSSRLESEGRLGGYGAHGSASAHYAEAAYGDEEPAAAAPAPRRQPSAASAAPRAAPAAGGDVPRSGALRRRSVDEDPFENPVIPAAVSAAPARRAAPAAASAAAAPKRSAAPVQEVDEPADEDEAAAEAKRIKKEKKKKKKEEEARKAAAALEQQTKAQSKAVMKPSASSSSASPPHAGGHKSNGSFDLSNYAEQPGRNGAAGGEIDLLSGAAMNGFAAANGGGAGGDHGEAALEDLFASSTLTDEQVSSPWGYHPSGNPFRSPNSAASGEEGEGEGEGQSEQTAASVAHNAALSPTGGLVNLNDLTAPRVDKNKQNTHVDSGVSMSMMRSIQPLGAPQQQQQQQQQNAARRSNVPSTIPLPQYGANGAFPGLDPLGGAGGGYPQHHPMQMGGPPLGPPPYGAGGYGGGYPMQGGYGQPQNPGMMMYGAHPGMHGGGQGPMLALMPPGMGSMGGYNQGPMGMQPHPQQAYGGPNGAYGGVPAPSPSAMTFTQMRQAPMKQQGNGPVIFEVPRAQPAPVDLMGGGGGNSYGQQNQQRGGQQQQQRF